MRRIAGAALVVLSVTGFSSESLAWGANGHEWVSGIAIEKLLDRGWVLRTPAIACATARLAAGAEVLRGLIVDA
jgi:hypothetical protein